MRGPQPQEPFPARPTTGTAGRSARGPGLAVLAGIVALLLAGCNDAPAAAGPPAGATATTGILHGVVVDDAVRPLAGVHVNVTFADQRLNATTGDDGLFRFTGLAPGTYIVEAGKRFYGVHQQALVVVAGVDDPPVARFQLVFEPDAVPFATLLKYEGFHECGMNVMRVCSNINILTSIVVCANTGICIGNVTGDRSFFVQAVDSVPTMLQSELTWEATLPAGEQLTQLLGAASMEELRDGMAGAYNVSSGRSPLMMRITNHEGESAWCRRVPDPPCSEQAMAESGIGNGRLLLGQVDAGPSVQHPMCGVVSPCGVGQSTQQAFTMYTALFYGYEAPLEWRFTDGAGLPPPPT